MGNEIYVPNEYFENKLENDWRANARNFFQVMGRKPSSRILQAASDIPLEVSEIAFLFGVIRDYDSSGYGASIRKNGHYAMNTKISYEKASQLRKRYGIEPIHLPELDIGKYFNAGKAAMGYVGIDLDLKELSYSGTDAGLTKKFGGLDLMGRIAFEKAGWSLGIMAKVTGEERTAIAEELGEVIGESDSNLNALTVGGGFFRIKELVDYYDMLSSNFLQYTDVLRTTVSMFNPEKRKDLERIAFGLN